MSKKRRARRPLKQIPPNPSSRQTSVRRCLHMLEACFPLAFVSKGRRTEWMVPLRNEVWDELRPLVVNEWGFDDATFYGVRSEYVNQYSYWEAMLNIGIRGDLTGLPSTAQGLREYIDKNPGVVVTKEERKKIKKLVVRWSLHHYPQPKRTEPEPELEPEKPARKQRRARPEPERDFKKHTSAPVTETSATASQTSPKPAHGDRQKRRTDYNPTVVVKKHRHPDNMPDSPPPKTTLAQSTQPASDNRGNEVNQTATVRKPGLLKLKKNNESGTDEGG